MARYSDFNTLIELTKLKKMDVGDREYGYNKFIQKGELEFHDYDTGFFDTQVYVYENGINECFVRIWVATIDDGDFGGWRKVTSREKAEQLVDDIANDVFKNMIAFPTKDELNVLLRRYGIAVDYEC